MVPNEKKEELVITREHIEEFINYIEDPAWRKRNVIKSNLVIEKDWNISKFVEWLKR